jgi:aspartate aminotransferase/aminotransferase
MTEPFRLADRTGRIDASGIRKIFDLARSIPDPINLSIGQPDFDVPEAVKEAAIAAIRRGDNKYTPTQGIAPLIDEVRRDEAAATGRSYAADQVLITSGVSGGLFLALLALVQEGDEVIIPDPYFVMYKHLVNLFGGTPVYLDTYDAGFGIDPARLEKLITPRTRLLLVNSPSNPTGRVLARSELEGIAAVCRKHGIAVISDEIYRAFCYVPFTPMAAVYEHTLTLVGHSKSYGMTGWRLGYATGPASLIQAMAKVQQYSFVCAPSVTQFAALACPAVDLTKPIADYRAKRDLMVGILSRRFRLGSPDGAFYLFAEVPGGDGDAFVTEAIKNRILVIPGSVFSERKTHIRICYTVPDDKLRAGAEALVRLAGG